MNEHIIVTPIGNDLVRLTPEPGYRLYNDITRRFYSVAEIGADTKHPFVAVLDGIDPEPHERTIEDAIKEKLAALDAFIASNKKFYIGRKAMWVGPNERSNLKNAAEALQAQGVTTVPYEGVTIPIETALQMIAAVEVYAAYHSMAEAQHRATISAKRSIERVDEYDFTTGYPESPVFNAE